MCLLGADFKDESLQLGKCYLGSSLSEYLEVHFWNPTDLSVSHFSDAHIHANTTDLFVAILHCQIF